MLVAHWAARAAYRELLSAGLRIFEYHPRVLHAKTAVVDGAVATVGTANLDYRSLFVNYELNLFSGSRALCTALEGQLLAVLAFTKGGDGPALVRTPLCRAGHRVRGMDGKALAVTSGAATITLFRSNRGFDR